MGKKTVFLTGSTGTMGFAGFQELYARKHQYNIVLLNRGSQRNKDKFKVYEQDPSVKIVWGDLTSYEDVLECVTGSDYVLHVGGLVSPAADYKLEETLKTNVTAAQHIVNAIKAQDDPDAVKLVYIGTVAQTGDRNPPIHWGRTGDPIKISVFDHYAISKTLAEQVVAESGLKYWVSLRQSGILYPEILKNYDPIMFHVPVHGVLEWATVEDSALLLANVCGEDVPEEFWRRFYNIGSGESYRISNYRFEELLLGAIGLDSPKDIFEANWFTTQNFHGQWYADSDLLDDYLHFRHNVPVEQYFKQLAASVPKYYQLSKLIPNGLIKKVGMKPMANTPKFGTMSWMKQGNSVRIKAYFGSVEKWKQIKSWDDVDTSEPSHEKTYLDHGYDETKDVASLDLKDMRGAAQFRGGECLSTAMADGDGFYKPLQWKCAFGHEFEMSPNLALKGGHWCPECLPMPWNDAEIAKVNPFYAQVWYPLHDKDEPFYFDRSIYEGMLDE